MNQTVECYGVHEDGIIRWLVQGRKGNNFAGLKAQCPFTVDGGMCNHLIPAAAPIPDRLHWDTWLKIFHDPLVQAMLPIPRPPGQNIFFVDDESMGALDPYLYNLARLSSPINSIIRPGWLGKIKNLEQELTASNVQPWVITQLDTKQQTLVDSIGRLATFSPRTVVLVGRPEMVASRPLQRIQTKITEFDQSGGAWSRSVRSRSVLERAALGGNEPRTAARGRGLLRLPFGLWVPPPLRSFVAGVRHR